LVITGAGPGDDPLTPVVEECGLVDWVDLRGWVDAAELADLRSRARALAFPTLAEGFGLPVLEAMVIGLPVIASDLPVLREVGGDAAVWFDPRDPASIAAALRTVATDPEAMLRASQAGLAQAAGFSWRRVAEETLDVFRAALADR
jgi:glycosyltransferase involved in cell wall biosynthesis